MSAEVGVAYARPERPMFINLVSFFIAVVLCLVGAALIHHGIGAAEAGPGIIITSMGLLTAGCAFAWAGLTWIWPGSVRANVGLFFLGLGCFIVSGILLAAHITQAAYAIVLTGVGIVLIAVGAQLGKESWKKLWMR